MSLMTLERFLMWVLQPLQGQISGMTCLPHTNEILKFDTSKVIDRVTSMEQGIMIGLVLCVLFKSNRPIAFFSTGTALQSNRRLSHQDSTILRNLGLQLTMTMVRSFSNANAKDLVPQGNRDRIVATWATWGAASPG